eukprot:EG_transcript_14611
MRSDEDPSWEAFPYAARCTCYREAPDDSAEYHPRGTRWMDDDPRESYSPAASYRRPEPIPYCYAPRLSYWEELLSEGALDIYRDSYYGPWSKAEPFGPRASGHIPDPVRVYDFEAEESRERLARLSDQPQPNDYLRRHQKYTRQLYNDQYGSPHTTARRKSPSHHSAASHSTRTSSRRPSTYEPYAGANPSSWLRGTQNPPALPYLVGYTGPRLPRPVFLAPACYLLPHRSRDPRRTIAYPARAATVPQAGPPRYLVPSVYRIPMRPGYFGWPSVARPRVNTYTWGVTANQAVLALSLPQQHAAIPYQAKPVFGGQCITAGSPSPPGDCQLTGWPVSGTLTTSSTDRLTGDGWTSLPATGPLSPGCALGSTTT